MLTHAIVWHVNNANRQIDAVPTTDESPSESDCLIVLCNLNVP